MEVDKKAIFPLVGPGHCQQLHPFIFMRWEESSTHFRPTLIREILARSGYEPRPSMPVGRPAKTSNIGRLDTSQLTLACPQSHPAALSRVLREGYEAIREVSVLSVTWHFVWTEMVLLITTQKTTYRTEIYRWDLTR